MANLAALAPITTAAGALSNLILVSPSSVTGYQPQNPPNDDGTVSTEQPPPSFLFHYEGEQTVTLESDITDHYVEDNTAVADQIALKPELITTHGFIGELNDVVPDLLKPLKFAADKLEAIEAYSPELTTTAELAYAEAFFLYQTAQSLKNSAVAAWSSVSSAFSDNDDGGEGVVGSDGLTKSSAPQNKQQTAFQQMYGYWRDRVLFTVQTPWCVFQNMAIKSLRAIQDAETRVITDFEVTFKIIRQASTLLDNGTALGSNKQSFQSYAGAQASDETDLGVSSPVSSIGLADGLASMGV